MTVGRSALFASGKTMQAQRIYIASMLTSSDTPSGCNHSLTLRKARANFKEFGACERSMIEHVCSSEQKANFKQQVRELIEFSVVFGEDIKSFAMTAMEE